MNESDYNRIREESWRRELTPAESAALREWLATHPDLRAECEADALLNRALGQLPNVPVPTNFTARVLQEVQRQAAAEARTHAPRRWWIFRSLLPRTAAAAVVLSAGLLTYHEHTLAKREQMVRGIVAMSSVPTLPTPEVLQDFDIIRQMDTGAAPDQGLLDLHQDLLALGR